MLTTKLDPVNVEEAFKKLIKLIRETRKKSSPYGKLANKAFKEKAVELQIPGPYPVKNTHSISYSTSMKISKKFFIGSGPWS